MLAQVWTPSGATCKGVRQLEATFIDVKNMYLHRDSNPGLWNTNALTSKLRRHMMKTAFHLNVPSDAYSSIPYTPLPGCFLILNLEAANKL